jgi:hypothetical protein
VSYKMVADFESPQATLRPCCNRIEYPTNIFDPDERNNIQPP